MTFNDADDSADSILTGGTLTFGVAGTLTTHTHAGIASAIAGIASAIAGSATLTKAETGINPGFHKPGKLL